MIGSFFIRSLVCMLIFLGLAGCAPKKIPLERPPETVWADFLSGISEIPPGQPFLINASVSYITPGQRNRIRSVLWGRINYPIRMDLSAGFGQTIAMWYEDDLVWQAYFPGENTTYVHHDGSLGASMLGYPSPLDLRATVMVLLGAFGELVPETYHRAIIYNGRWKYEVKDHLVQEVVLAQDGTVHSMAGQGWQVVLGDRTENGEFSYYSRLDMELSDSDRALVRIRSVSFNGEGWEDDQLILETPPGAGVVYLPDF
ncbi:hypothetical protein [Desulfonatronovibrio hydrogenovorans]|uniref:hypothetical protein n=1 Tax=Desulfonatronovibrio hydrogenovorans TaxID=53245 RepID=UPI0004903C03|nr:hypothetical protein [Desulfonatronovibrio hydrogenovorans]